MLAAERAKERDLSIPEVYDREIGSMWAHLARTAGLTPDDTIVEVAPGMSPKVGLGLAEFGFKGTLYVVEPCLESLEVVVGKYKDILPNARIVPLPCPLKEACREISEPVNAILSNHPLDDMLLAQLPVESERLQRFFADNYVGPDPNRTRLLWSELQSDDDFFARARQNVIGDWLEAMRSLDARVLGIAQYHSYFFRKHGLDIPDREAKSLRDEIARHCGDIDQSGRLAGQDSPIAEAERWLLLIRGS